jgi:hypothetical protein
MMTLQEERRMVYTMLSERKITVEEAEALLAALEESAIYPDELHLEGFFEIEPHEREES